MTSRQKPTKKKPAKKKSGRPRKYSDAQIIAALKAKKGLIFLAAKKLHCTPMTIHVRAAKNPLIRKTIENSREEIVDTAEEKLFESIKDKEAWAIGFALKTIGRNRGYVERSEVRHGGDKDAPPIQHDHARASIDELPLDLRRQILDHIRKQKELAQQKAIAPPTENPILNNGVSSDEAGIPPE